MEVTALCIRLWMDMLVLLLLRIDHSYFAQKANVDFPRILPDRLQFFEYENVSVICEELGGLTEWRVMRRLNERSPTDSYIWQSSAPSCTINPAFKRHSGEYWCEDAEGNTRKGVIITINPGSVILELPASPVVEGDKVSLYCRKKDTQSNHIADFYKDGSKLGTWYSNNMTIQNVSKSDEGLYKCSISGAGESPQSWLTVLQESKAADEEIRPSSHPPNLPSLLWIVVLVALMLLVMGLLLCRKHRVFLSMAFGLFCSPVLGCLSSGKPTPGSHSPADPTDSEEDKIADSHHATYNVVKKQRREKVSDGDNAGDPDLMTYAVFKKQRKKKELDGSGAASKRRLTDESVFYSTVYYRRHIPD
ncbi:high affinity immunoglobulin gamma Fc receptor IB-like [Perca fluviatilis]|uniref:high affinity immunoglobulin gamma Fc receptor IB-like n=1 Tax=Perca fluviatilis TaxID=8168 RepID=UPI001964B4C7|nr:high affinity immunoglobulin gamma Fc receptor IB-like [Perca fluviatilis]